MPMNTGSMDDIGEVSIGVCTCTYVSGLMSVHCIV